MNLEDYKTSSLPQFIICEMKKKKVKISSPPGYFKNQMNWEVGTGR